MADLQTRLGLLIAAIGADIKNVDQKSSTTSSATPAPIGFAKRNTYTLTALGAAAAFAVPSGTPVDGNTLMIRVKDDATARALTWDAIYRSLDTTNAPLPSTTVSSKWLYLGFVYNGTDAKWDLVSVLKQT